jgi:hypothetical protein
MDRRKFLGRLGIGVGAAVVAPSLLSEEVITPLGEGPVLVSESWEVTDKQGTNHIATYDFSEVYPHHADFEEVFKKYSQRRMSEFLRGV